MLTYCCVPENQYLLEESFDTSGALSSVAASQGMFLNCLALETKEVMFQVQWKQVSLSHLKGHYTLASCPIFVAAASGHHLRLVVSGAYSCGYHRIITNKASKQLSLPEHRKKQQTQDLGLSMKETYLLITMLVA